MTKKELTKLMEEKQIKAQYVKYLEKNLNEYSKTKKDKITLHFSTYQACKLEQAAVKNGILISDLIKKIFIDFGILNKDDVTFSNKKKFSSKFINANCNEFKELKTNKLYHVRLSEYAKAKIYRKLVKELKMDLSYYVKSRMLKNVAKDKMYAIFEPNDLAY